MDLVKDITLGYNIKNTLDVCQADGDVMTNEQVEGGENSDDTIC